VHSLRLRILAAIVLVVIVGVAITAVNATQSTAGQFERYVAHGQVMRKARFTASLTDFYQKNGSWAGVQPYLAQMSSSSGDRILLTDAHDVVVADSDQSMIGRKVQLASGTLIVDAGGGTAGHVYYNPLLDSQAGVADFLGGVTRSVWIGALIAVAIALLASILLSRRILRPVEELTAAAREMQKGNLSVRVNVSEKDEIGVLASSFNAMADSLAEQERLRRNMVSDVAHELRTPLSNIRGYLEAARDGLVEVSPELVDSLFEEASSLSRLADDLRDLAQAEAGHLRIEPVALDLRGTIRAVIDKAPSSGRDVEISPDLPADLPLVLADPQRVEQILRNLIHNALDYTPDGGAIWVQAMAQGRFVRVAVKDTGIGIEPEHLPHLFDRFYRPDPSRSRATGGAGLGLAIVKQLVEAQGGQVAVESVPGAGSTFSFTLPIFEEHPVPSPGGT
jgi:signal transduction histidine kinase